MDCARAALRLGASVTLVYRGPENCLRASPKEVALTREEGAAFLFQHRPLRLEGNELTARVVFETPMGASIIGCDRVILALGQQPCPPPWLGEFNIATEADGRIRVDSRGRTSHTRIWAGGDNTHGPDLAVTAIAAGWQAAQSILDGLRSFKPIGRRS